MTEERKKILWACLAAVGFGLFVAIVVAVRIMRGE